jgi:hypothetical protein
LPNYQGFCATLLSIPAQGEGDASLAAAPRSANRKGGLKPLSIQQGAYLGQNDTCDAMTVQLSRPFMLDLHGLSQAAARIALLQVGYQIPALLMITKGFEWMYAECPRYIFKSFVLQGLT